MHNMATSETNELFYRDFKHVINYLEEEKQLMDAHMVDFFTSNHWETLLPRNIREDLESLPQQLLTSLPNACPESKHFERLGENLKRFLKEARLAQLKSFSWVTDQKDFTSERRADFISHIMTPKKSYEVDVMSDVINRFAKQFQVNKILDLGSGKGYLSQHLALQYGLNVIGVDSSDSNTQNAAKRNERLLKAWKGLARKFQREKVDTSSNEGSNEGNITSDHLDSQPLGKSLDVHVGNTTDGNSELSSKHCNSITCQISHVHTYDDNNMDASCLNQGSHVDKQNGSHLFNPIQSTVEAESKKPIVSEADVVESKHCTDGACKSKLAAEISSQEPFLQSSVSSLNSQHCDSVTHCDMQCRNIMCCKIVDSGLAANTVNSNSQQSQTTDLTSFVPVTGFVDQSFVASGGLRRLFDELHVGTSDGVDTRSNGMFLVGLHTCGDLAPMALQIFVSDASVRVICVVGCCYHLVSQEFGGSNDSANSPGFPMSQFLKPFKLHISRNATMVAQQAADRIAMESKCPPPSVLHRAILQEVKSAVFVCGWDHYEVSIHGRCPLTGEMDEVFAVDYNLNSTFDNCFGSGVILKEKFDLDGRGMHVGKTGAKCKDFKEYVHKCLNKLGLEDRISEFSDGEVESYLKRFKNQEKQLHAFHQLRAAIAPCIESVFLLDRLCYLYEQGYKCASIVKLFDPVKSPRCYAIIAHKT